MPPVAAPAPVPDSVPKTIPPTSRLYKPLTLRRFDAEQTGEEMSLEDQGVLADVVLQELGLTFEQLRKIIFASDMDNTMFVDIPEINVIGDLGIIALLEKLADPTFWQFSPATFRNLLLPKEYLKAASEHLPGGSGQLGINPQTCQSLLTIHQDIFELYKAQKLLVNQTRRTAQGEQPVIDINSPIVNEFALKMIRFESLVKEVEKVLVREKGMDALLMRVRLFAGKNISKAHAIGADIMARSVNFDPNNPNGDGHIYLQMQPDAVAAAIEVGVDYENRIGNIKPYECRRVVVVNESIRRLMARVSIELEAFSLVISANLKALVQEAVKGGRYNGLVDKTIASKLRATEDDVFQPRFQGRAINGEVKVDALKALEQRIGKTTKIAAGDSRSGDGPMGIHVLKPSGIFVITGQTFEDIQRTFHGFPEEARAAGVREPEKHIWTMAY